MPVDRDPFDEVERLRMRGDVLRQIGHHLDRRIDRDVESQLACQGRGDVGRDGVAAFEREDAGRIIHRPRKQARKDQFGNVVGAILGFGPSIVFAPARAFAADPVRIGPAQSGVLHRFVRIDRNPVCGRGFDDAQVMVHLFLPVVPDENFITIGIARNNPASVRDIAGLHRVDAEFAIKRHRVIKLALVDIDIATRFVMADDAHALLARVPSDFSDVEIGIGGGEVVVAPIAEPIAVPAKVPTFDQHAAETMLGGEIDMAFGVCRRGAVFFARCPTAFIEVHIPPDADVFVWDHPADIA